MRKIAAICAACVASACSAIPKMAPPVVFPDHNASDRPSAAAVSAGERLQVAQQPDSPSQRLIYYRGVHGSLEAPDDDPALAGKSISLAFVNASAVDVARAVIGELLGQPVAIADGVAGTVTLTAAEPAPANEALAALENVLAESGLALLRTRQGFLLARLGDAQSDGVRFNRSGTPVGYGIAFVPTRYASATEIAALIQPIVSDRLSVAADDMRSAIVLRGPQVDIATAREAIETFDTPQLIDRVFGMFRLQYADATSLKSELDSVLAASASGTSPGDILALPRLNQLFVTARARASFDEIRGWIERLDRPSEGEARRLRHHVVRSVSAETLAEQLNAAFGGALGRGFASGSDSAVQPGFRTRMSGAATDDGQTWVSVDPINNALIFRATTQEYREIVDLLEQMDVAPPQVLIEAIVAEVSLNDELNFGVRWFFQRGDSTFALSNNEQGSLAPVFPGFNYSYTGANARAALSAISSMTDVTVLSAPSIMVVNNEPATLQVGDEVPIVTQQARGVTDSNAPIVSTLQLRETGVILNVRPRINADDMVVLEIVQEVSDVTRTTTSGIDSPTIQQRKFTSTVAVRDRGTIALGGLMRESYANETSGVPVLKEIPLVGNAFKSRSISKRRTELIVFLTPHIVRNDDDAASAIRYIRREMKRLGWSGD